MQAVFELFYAELPMQNYNQCTLLIQYAIENYEKLGHLNKEEK